MPREPPDHYRIESRLDLLTTRQTARLVAHHVDDHGKLTRIQHDPLTTLEADTLRAVLAPGSPTEPNPLRETSAQRLADAGLVELDFTGYLRGSPGL